MSAGGGGANGEGLGGCTVSSEGGMGGPEAEGELVEGGGEEGLRRGAMLGPLGGAGGTGTYVRCLPELKLDLLRCLIIPSSLPPVYHDTGID